MKIKRILLVDDDEGFNFLNQATLQESGLDCQIDVALNGKEALQQLALQKECPDIILLDLNMPLMDGFEFLNKFSDMATCVNSSNIFVLSSSERDEDRRKSLGNKMVKGFFSKPLSEVHIRQIMQMSGGPGIN